MMLAYSQGAVTSYVCKLTCPVCNQSATGDYEPTREAALADAWRSYKSRGQLRLSCKDCARFCNAFRSD
jgi:hypothetical protein